MKADSLNMVAILFTSLVAMAGCSDRIESQSDSGAEPNNEKFPVRVVLDESHRLRDAKDFTGAKAGYQRVLDDSSAAVGEISEAQVWYAHVLRYEQDHEGAQKEYRKLLELSAGDPHHFGEGGVWLAETYLLQEKPLKAIGAFRMVLSLPNVHPDHIKHAERRIEEVREQL